MYMHIYYYVNFNNTEKTFYRIISEVKVCLKQRKQTNNYLIFSISVLCDATCLQCDYWQWHNNVRSLSTTGDVCV